jgi:hypothetical protein
MKTVISITLEEKDASNGRAAVAIRGNGIEIVAAFMALQRELDRNEEMETLWNIAKKAGIEIKMHSIKEA